MSDTTELTLKVYNKMLMDRFRKVQSIVDEMDSERDYATHMGNRGFTEYEDTLFERLQEELESIREEAEGEDEC